MRSRLVVAVAIVAALMLTAAACSSSQSSSHSIEGGVLRVGSISPIDSLNPFVAFQQNSFISFEYMYPYLVQYDRSLHLIGDFATSWSEAPDGLTWTFHTRPHAEWSDGSPVTAADAAWTINTAVKFQNGPTGAVAGSIAHIKDAVAPDADTLILHYSQPVANALPNLQQLPILPRHIWAAHATGNGNGLRTFANSAPIVSGGPFMLTSYVKDQDALFKRNAHWYGVKPHIDGFGFAFFSNEDALITALKTNQIDFVDVVPPTDVTTVRKAGFAVTVTPKMGFRDFIINSSPYKTSNRELLNPLVRLAFAHAINREQIVKTAWLGYAQPGDSIVPPAAGLFHDPQLHPETFNIPLANKLLNQAGYRMGPNGVRIANGHPMSYTVLFASDETGAGDRAFQIIQTDFSQIGVKLTQRTLDVNAINAAIVGANTKYSSWDLAMWDWTVMPVDPDFILNVVTCGAWGSWSDSGYCNHHYDQLYREQGATLNPVKRLSMLYDLQRIIYNTRPYIVLTYDDVVEAHSTKWAGFVPSPVGSINSLSKQTLLGVHRVA